MSGPTARSIPELRQLLRLIVITDQALARPRTLEQVVEASLAAGARAIQLRAKRSASGAVLEMALRLRRLTREAGALLIVNDRTDIALAASADGVHLGPEDLSVAMIRNAAPSPFLIGYSTDDPALARAAEAAGADYVGCGAVWRTTSKDVADEAIGTARLAEVVRAVRIPVVGIGGVTAERAREVARAGAAGAAVVGAVMAAPDPGRAVREIMDSFESGRRGRGPSD